MEKLLRLTVSYENSADESISYSLGVIFAHNPGAIENGIKEFSEIQRASSDKKCSVGLAKRETWTEPGCYTRSRATASQA